jgi:hypothetical protein
MIVLAAADTISGIAGAATAITYSIEGMELVGTTETYKALAQGQLGSSSSTLYTVPASTQAFIKGIHLANTTTSPVSGIKLFVSGTAAANQLTGSLTIPANGWAVYEENGWRIYDSRGRIV